MKRGYVDTPFGQIHYCEEGKGYPVLFLHQTPTSLDEFTDVLPIVGKQYRAISMDTLGYGSSAKTAKQPTIEDYGQCVAYLLDALNIKKLSIVGSLTGAWVAVDYAIKHLERVDKLVFTALFLITPQEAVEMEKDYLFKPLEITEDGAFLTKVWQYYRKALPQMKVENTYRIVLSLLESGVNQHQGHVAVIQSERDSKLKKLQCPVLLVYSESDFFIKKKDETAKAIPNCTLHVIKGKSFAMGYENPQAMAKEVMDFIKG